MLLTATSNGSSVLSVLLHLCSISKIDVLISSGKLYGCFFQGKNDFVKLTGAHSLTDLCARLFTGL